MKIVIIGNGPAAVKAIEAIGSNQAVSEAHQLEITVLADEEDASYSPMFLADHLTGELEFDEILIGGKHDLCPERLLGERVVRLEDNRKRVITESGQEIEYDRLLIASGASPIRPDIDGVDKEGVHFFNNLVDVRKLSEQISKTQKVAIIGAGVIGIEAAIAFNKLGWDVLVVEFLGQILPQVLDKELAGYVEDRLRRSGIEFMLGESVTGITGDRRATGVVVKDKEIPADLIIIAVGVKPNIGFLNSSGVRTNQGVLVNNKMETNIPGVYAAGDVTESADPYGRYELVFNWYNAIDQGWTAGCNLIGIESIYAVSPSIVALKGMEPSVVSIGRKYPDVKEYKILSSTNGKKGVYEKAFIKDNIIDCYQAIGITERAGLMYGYIRERRDISFIGDHLLEQRSLVSLMI